MKDARERRFEYEFGKGKVALTRQNGERPILKNTSSHREWSSQNVALSVSAASLSRSHFNAGLLALEGLGATPDSQTPSKARSISVSATPRVARDGVHYLTVIGFPGCTVPSLNHKSH